MGQASCFCTWDKNKLIISKWQTVERNVCRDLDGLWWPDTQCIDINYHLMIIDKTRVSWKYPALRRTRSDSSTYLCVLTRPRSQCDDRGYRRQDLRSFSVYFSVRPSVRPCVCARVCACLSVCLPVCLFPHWTPQFCSHNLPIHI